MLDFVINIFKFDWLSIIFFVIAEIWVELEGIFDQVSATEDHAWIRISAFCWFLFLLFTTVWAEIAHILKMRIRTIFNFWLCGFSHEAIMNRASIFTLWNRDLRNLQRKWVFMDTSLPTQPTRYTKWSIIVLLYTFSWLRWALNLCHPLVSYLILAFHLIIFDFLIFSFTLQ